MLMAQPSTYFYFLKLIWWRKWDYIKKEKLCICWWLSHQHYRSFSKSKSVHMLMAEPSTYAHFPFFKKIGYVDGSAVNIWTLFSDDVNSKLYICWWLSRQHMHTFKLALCWRLTRQHITPLAVNICIVCIVFSIMHK